MTRMIYRLLTRSFGQGVLIPKIVDFDILDVVSIGDIDVAVDVNARRSWWRG